MVSTNLFALFKPDVLGTAGFAYGRTTSEPQQGYFDVTEEEAMSGVGTYVGSTLCVARVLQGKPKVWEYGTVVGYSWRAATKEGVLHVTFTTETCDDPFVMEELHDLPLETYALRPCFQIGVADVMPAEMKSIHTAVHAHFNGSGQTARRSSATILRKVSMNLINESQVVPLFNLAKTRVDYLEI
ncbi:hypothetical protein PHYSODRAFT_447255, partial [Phytophthora sojae]